MSYDIYKLPGLKCPECGDEGTVRIMLSVEGDDEDLITCKQCGKLEIEIDPSDLANAVQAVLSVTEDEDVREAIAKALDLT